MEFDKSDEQNSDNDSDNESENDTKCNEKETEDENISNSESDIESDIESKPNIETDSTLRSEFKDNKKGLALTQLFIVVTVFISLMFGIIFIEQTSINSTECYVFRCDSHTLILEHYDMKSFFYNHENNYCSTYINYTYQPCYVGLRDIYLNNNFNFIKIIGEVFHKIFMSGFKLFLASILALFTIILLIILCVASSLIHRQMSMYVTDYKRNLNKNYLKLAAH